MPDISRLLRLMSLGQPLPAEVDLHTEVDPDSFIQCLCCQKPFKTLRRHLQIEHGMTEDSYRKAFALAASEPLVSASYAAARARHLAAYGRAQRS